MTYSAPLAPIVLFVFKRPEHARRTLESLAKNPEFEESQLYIYCDGARNPSESDQVEETRKIVHNWLHPNKSIIERECNWGLANSVIDGVTLQCKTHGKVVVVEDDMVVSPYFLRYMNEALIKFQDDDRVISIHGYSFPVGNLPEAFFIKGASCWGWATWERGWALFEPDGVKLFKQLQNKKLMYRFDVLGSYPYKRMLMDQIKSINDSWAIRWYASALVKDKLSLHPGRSLVYNIGLDGSGQHCDQYDGFNTKLGLSHVDLSDLEVKEDAVALQAWKKFFKSVRREKVWKTVFSFQRIIKYMSRYF